MVHDRQSLYIVYMLTMVRPIVKPTAEIRRFPPWTVRVVRRPTSTSPHAFPEWQWRLRAGDDRDGSDGVKLVSNS